MKPDKALFAKIAAFLFCILLPLWYSPLTRELLPQKDVIFALALLFAASSATLFSTLSLVIGVLISLWFPGGSHETIPLFALPLIIDFFHRFWKQKNAIKWVLVGALLVAILALLQGLGVPVFLGSSTAFSLPYIVLTGPLGNPNYLSLYLLLSLTIWWVLQYDKPYKKTEVAWLLLLAFIILWARSYLGWLIFSLLFLGIIILKYQKRRVVLPILFFGAGLLVWQWKGFIHALWGRIYLLEVHLFGLSPQILLRGIGPGTQSSAFLHWQAGFLEEYPTQTARWSFPEHAHNDLLALLLTWGLPVFVAGTWIFMKRLRWKEGLPRNVRLLSLLVLVFAATGATVLYVSPLCVLAGALIAAITTPKIERQSPAWTIWLTRVAIIFCIIIIGTRAYSDHLAKQTIQAGVEGRYEEALRISSLANTLPFYSANHLFLQGRILLEAKRCNEAIKPLKEAIEELPLPLVFSALAHCYRTEENQEALQELIPQWKLYAPHETIPFQ